MSDRSGGVKVCPRIRITGIKDIRPVVTAEEVGVRRKGGVDHPVIRLSLRKPRDWGWKLTTSASSPTVVLPVVCLVDDNGNVLNDDDDDADNNINRLVHCQSVRSDRGLCHRVKNMTPLDRARHWNETRDTSSSESEISRRVRGQRRKQDSGYKSLRRSKDKEGHTGSTSSKTCKDLRTDTGNASPRTNKDLKKDSGNMSFRRRKDTGNTSLRRGSSTDSNRSGQRRHRRDNFIGPWPRPTGKHSDPDVDVYLTTPDSQYDDDSVPPRRLRRRREPALSVMGSNVSRQGLSGRRTQSSGNLCNGNKILARDVGRILATCGDSAGQKDRNRFCGSLPNYLDGEYAGNELDDRCCNNNNNNNNNNNSVASSSMKARLEEQTRGLELRLLPQQDLAQQDQGYASERSPEDEHPPPLPPPEPVLDGDNDSLWCLTQHYPFITPDALFEVTLLKGNRGLGLSVTGGVETGEQWPGLIRIKRIFPHQPAWQSGQLTPGDILLAANGVPLTGLTNYQALEVLRTSPSTVVLEMCRPPNNVFCIMVPSEPPVPPRRDVSYRLSSSHLVAPLPLLQIDEPCGEFDIILKKVNRSLGFTLRKEDESVLGHYVRALVREPALSDGRIRPGDKIVEVNDVPLSPMSHEEAVTFLRQCGETVKLRLYRDAAQTPVAALSPTESDPPGCTRPRPMLRQEARDMLSDLAVRKLSPTNSSSSNHGGLLQCMSSGSTPGTSPRRRRLTKTPPPDVTIVAKEKLGGQHIVSSHIQGLGECSMGHSGGTDVMDLRECSNLTLPQRPQFLNLQNDSDSLPTSRKQKYTFAVPEPIQLDSCDELDMPTQDTSHSYRTSSEDNGGLLMEPMSLPPLSSTSSTSTAFSYRNPAYHSANPIKSTDEETMTECLSDQDISGKVFEEQGGGTCSLLKWKGVVFTPQNGVNNVQNNRSNLQNGENSSQITGNVLQNSEGNMKNGCSTSGHTQPLPENGQVLIVELNRGWNSRLGFSLQSDGYRTYVSAVYADSVAARDGRIRARDQLLTVNDENVENMSTAEIIDLLRKIRGTIEIRVFRKSGPNLQPS